MIAVVAAANDNRVMTLRLDGQRSKSGRRAMWYVLIAITVILLAAVRFLSREQSAAMKPERDSRAAMDATAPRQANRDPRDAPIERWLVCFPDLLDCLQ